MLWSKNLWRFVGAVTTGLCSLAVVLFVSGCGPAVSDEELGTVIYDVQEIPGGDEPYVFRREQVEEQGKAETVSGGDDEPAPTGDAPSAAEADPAPEPSPAPSPKPGNEPPEDTEPSDTAETPSA